MDNVDTEVTRDGHTYRFVDTAGIRRKGKTTLVAEKLSVVMARRGLERCDVALLVVDGEQGVTQGDAQIANYAEQSDRSVVIVINKWDLAVEAAGKAPKRATPPAPKANRGGRRGERHRPEDFETGRLLFEYEKMIRGKLKFLSYAPIVFLSANTGERVEKLWPLIDPMLERARAEKHFHAGAEPLAQGRSGPAARHHAQGAPGAHLLHHPGQDRAAHVSDVHQPEKSAAFQLRTLSGKPDTRQI